MTKRFVLKDVDKRVVTDDEGYVRFWDTKTQAVVDAMDISKRLGIELFVREANPFEEGCLTIQKSWRIET